MLVIVVVLMLSYSIETVSAYSTKTITVQAGNKYAIWTDLNTGDKFQVIISVTGGTNNDIDLIITDPQGKTLVSGRVNQQYSTDINADVAGRYNFQFDNSFSVVSDKQVTFSYQTVSQSQNPTSSNSTQTPDTTNSNPTPQERHYYVYTAQLPDYATSYASNVIYDATNAWISANPNIKFYKADTEGQADLDVQWIRDYGTVAGTLGEYVTGTKLIQVGLGDSNCMGTWQPYSTKTVEHIATHEIGHFLGLGHSTDPNNVMYPYTPVEYGQVTTQKSLAAGYVSFIPFCTYKDSTSYSYSVTTDDPTYGFKVYVIPSRSEFDGIAQNNLSFNHYSDSGCYGENFKTYSGTCEGISKGSGLLIVLDNRQTTDLTQLTVTQQEVPFTTGTMQTTVSTTVTYNYPSKAAETQATIQKAITDAQAALQPQIDAATKAKADAEAQAAAAAQAQSQAEAQATADAQAKAQADAQAAAAAQAQAQAESQARDAENAKIEAQKQAQEDIAKAKADAEEKIAMMSLSTSKKDFYKNQITELKTGIDTTNSSLSKLNFESPVAQDKIKEAQKMMGAVISDYTWAKTNWIAGNDTLNEQNFNASIQYFDNMSPNLVSAGNDLASISGLMQDAQKIEDEYQKGKHRFCFLFWCF